MLGVKTPPKVPSVPVAPGPECFLFSLLAVAPLLPVRASYAGWAA